MRESNSVIADLIGFLRLVSTRAASKFAGNIETWEDYDTIQRNITRAVGSNSITSPIEAAIALSNAFIWDYSNEGAAYWAVIYERLRKLPSTERKQSKEIEL